MVSGYHRDDKMAFNMYNDLVFKKKSMRIDWRKIAAVDLDRISREMDVLALQENIDHLTFCNIDVELDTRVMDPTYVKLFKMSQFTIEYLMHSQNYLTDVISTIEGQLNKALLDADHHKTDNDRVQKELSEVKKENKKRKKMIETQQGLMNANSSNYHNCSYCSKVFLNVSYLQAHITRRHADLAQTPSKQLNTDIEKELARIKERLKNTENDLVQERTARLAGMSNAIMPIKNTTTAKDNSAELIKQMDSIKNAELKKQKEEFKKTNDLIRSELKELTARNIDFEREIKELQEQLGRKSNVGWMKDDIDVQKDSAIKQKQEIEKLNMLLEDYEKQVEELKTKWKSKEATMKKKHLKELNEKCEEIENLIARIAELESSIGKTDNELLIRLEELQNQLSEEQKQHRLCQLEVAELKNRPPPVTPRQPPEPLNRSSSPEKTIEKSEKSEKPERPIEKPQKPKRPTEKPSKAADVILAGAVPQKKFTQSEIDTYLPEQCPLTAKTVQKNPTVLARFREAAVKYFNEELDQLGIDPADKTLSTKDFVMKSSELKGYRVETNEQLPIFNENRQLFAELCDKYASQRLNMSMRSTNNRVTFKPDLIAQDGQHLKNTANRLAQNQRNKQVSESSMHSVDMSKTMDESEETDDDVSLSNALESNDDDDTEPTKSLITENLTASKRTPSPRKLLRQINQEELSDLESISQLLTDRSGSRRVNRKDNNGNKSTSKVEENRRKIESQLDKAYAKGTKPAPNAVAVGRSNNKNNEENLKNESFSSISDLESAANKRPKSGLKSTLSESSSIWISETHDISNAGPNVNVINKVNDSDRPATANSLKTSNFDSDEDTVLN